MVDRLKWVAPINCSLNITGRCNLRCLHCSASADMTYAKDMTTAQLLGVLGTLDRLGICKVHISGGEPLTRSDFFQIMSALSEKQIPTTLFTNATLISPDIARRLKALGNILSVSTSLDGATARSHDVLRGVGSFDRATRGIRLLVEAGFRVHATCIINKANRDEFPAVADRAAELGITIAFNPATLVGRARENVDLLKFTKHEMDLIYDSLNTLAAERPHVHAGIMQEWPRGRVALARSMKTQIKPGLPLAHCDICKEAVAIRPDGWVVPCNSFWEYEIGNVLHTDLQEIYRSEKAERIRDLFRHASHELEGCSECLYTGMCSGGCRACAYASSHSLMGVDEFRCVKRYLEAEEAAVCSS
jgi:radical SAM protein with 4Fe4S-binding SPASM domain